MAGALRGGAVGLHRYWIVLERPASLLGRSFGITARSASDALVILSEHLGRLDYEVAEMRQDVMPAELDQKHVVPNMGNPFRRGIWWPAQGRGW